MKQQKGISLIALIITIIVIIILAAIVIGVALTTPENANRAKFASDMSEVQHAVATKLANNYNQYITNPDSVDLNSGFTRVTVSGAPESFDSFALQGVETGTIGYMVKLDTIKMEQLTIGQEYKTATSVTFGTTDTFVYDTEGEVFYALGYKYDGAVYYSISDLEEGGVPVVTPSEEEPEPVDPSILAGINLPVLGTGMVEVYWDGFSEIVRGDAGFDVINWYNYIAQTEDTIEGGTSKWANAKLNGSYFVWIPRYAYKITYYTAADKQIVSATPTLYGDIDVLFMHGTSSTKYIDKATNTAQDLPGGYIVHPAFTNNIALGGWDSELTGFWVAKFEASRSDATAGANGTSNTLKIVPSVRSWTSLNTGTFYTRAREYKPEFNSHMMKNSEWGAVAYLTHSKYGRNGTEVTINNSGNKLTGSAGASVSEASSATAFAYNTIGGVLASSTGNIYGIYDLSGGMQEYVAAYYTGSTVLGIYGASFVYIDATTTINTTGTKYATPYNGTDLSSDYKIGDATYEVSQWNQDSGSSFLSAQYPFMSRGGSFVTGVTAGPFNYSRQDGNAYSSFGFRVCLSY